ncbi:hypothetical protein [Stenotrophomonas maltophilia]|uniref:hypothetical protein n=1 Tax=Stenotrophomonas maltophilia TaxID=40324 RepID=UPI00289421FF|nr:hypothetical protein [Stenotrophomonas maltophilia]MDT3487537.1 hypothetical protein [Stenotrophomonas maltophilia]
MIDFVKAAQNGINAHSKAEREKYQIAQTIAEARRQLREHFGEFFDMGIETRSKRLNSGTKTTAPLESIALHALSLTATSLPLSYRVRAKNEDADIDVPYDALIAKWGRKGAWELCRVQQEGAGFPIRLRYDSKDVTCRDVRTFESSLADVLGSATAGEAFARISALAGNADLEARNGA